ncbi:nucleotide-binding protein [Alsobacter sp. SYSU BS001988]
MRTITLVTQKGGTGKTTIAASLAVAAAAAGESVVALDLDAQRSLAGWGEARSEATVAVDQVGAEFLPRLPQVLEALKGRGFTLAILDTAGVGSTGGNLAMKAATLCLVPARPSRLDLQATLPTLESLVRLGMRDRFAFVLNQCPTGRGTRSSEAARGLAEFGVLADPPLGLRADHQDAMATGQGVTEYAGKGKAADEIRMLWAWVDHKMKAKPARKSVRA